MSWLGNVPELILLLISAAIVGDKIQAADLIIFGPSPSNPVAFDGSNAEIYDNTWSLVICGILKFTLSGTLRLTKFPSFDRSGPLVSVLALFNIFAMDEKYSLSLVYGS